jgi:nitroimidazol reductase NimA-like FMN-containing flavoprotein (pyridoxamine 5'-phosphate oxidase superfamily)
MREAGYGSPLSEPQREEFLQRESLGTLAIATGDDAPPYSIPMAYAYNGVVPMVFQFVAHAESEKMRYVEEGRPATLTVTDHRSGGWVSCLVQGRLSPVPEGKTSTAEQIFDRHGPAEDIEIFQQRDDYHLEYWRLLAAETHGRHSGTHPFPV